MSEVSASVGASVRAGERIDGSAGPSFPGGHEHFARCRCAVKRRAAHVEHLRIGVNSHRQVAALRASKENTISGDHWGARPCNRLLLLGEILEFLLSQMPSIR